MSQKFIKQFFIGSGVLLVLCALAVVVFDPFFQYHKPLPGLKEILTEKEYQVPGTLKNFEYDSVIAGSSVAENYYNDWFNQGFDCNVVKAIRSYGATADLCYFLDMAFEHQELKYVFYNLDPSALVADLEPTYELTGSPMYLYDDNYFNDLEYVLNKDVLFERVPYLLAQSLVGDYDENDSYNWSQWKQFNSDMALGLYMRKTEIAEMKPENHYEELLRGNLKLLTDRISAHPETTFYIFVPPYSMLWWDSTYRDGDTDAYLYNMEQAMETLLGYDNVRFFYFQNDTEVITNLENYMDTLHFSQDINHYICNCLIEGSHEITEENYRETMEDMRRLAYEIPEELIAPYEDRLNYEIPAE
ncbi:MAG: SGNH/GDSL hydrolase family protein [Lachnospiraceae bacterium]|nr:SGNH/GDSL hydrolase family protein [Lachnospiraceae bacterium]